MNRPPAIWGIVPCLSKIDTLGPRGGAALGFDARAHSDQDCGCQWKRTDFPTEEALRKCKITWHEDLPRHIYLLLDSLGLQFRWIVTRMGKGRALVSSADLVVDDHKKRTLMAMYANDRDVIEDLLYCHLKFLRSDCTDAIAIFAQHRVQDEFCAQKVWEALLTAFPLNHKRMQTVLLDREFGRLMAWDGHSKADVDSHFGDVNETLATLKFLESTIDLTEVFKSVLLATLESSQTKALTKAYASIMDNLDDDQDLTFQMIQQACTRKLRRRQDRSHDSRGREMRNRPVTPRCPSDPLGVARKLSPQPNRPDGAVVTYLCNILDDNDEKPYRVLKAAGCAPRLRPTGTPLMWSSRCTRLLSVTCLQPLKSVPRQVFLMRSLKILTLLLMLNFYICLLWEAYRDCFPDFSLSLRFFSLLEFSQVEGSLRYQALLFFFVISEPLQD